VQDRHDEQVAYWNGAGGTRWVAQQERTDLVMAELARRAVAHAAIRPGETVLDIGCGCGATLPALREAVGLDGRVVGLDVSAPMLGRAQARLRGVDRIEFLLADAAGHAFQPASIDLLFSRFGVMFFGDPIAAFGNLRRALKPDGRIVFACWQAPSRNPWALVPLNAAYLHLPRLPPLGPDDPGPFSFAEPDRVRRILRAAGFAEPEFDGVEVMLDVAGGDGLDAALAYVMEIGPASRALDNQPDLQRGAVATAITQALAPYVEGSSVRLGGAIWLVRARAA
jgi:SAM-dependent methyltransferase